MQRKDMPGGYVLAGWGSLREFVECAGLMLPAFRHGAFLDPAVLDERKQRCTAEMIAAYVRAHGLAGPHVKVQDKHQPAAEPAQRKKTSKKHPGLAALADQLAALRGQADEASTAAPARQKIVTQYITEAANMYFRSPATNVDPRHFWSMTTELSMLVPGAHYLLSHSMGNAFGERTASRAQHLLSNKRVMSLDVQRKLLLNVNGHH